MMKRRIKPLLAALLLGLAVGLAVAQALTAGERMSCMNAVQHWRGRSVHWQHEAAQLNDELGRINQRSEKHLYIQDVAVTVTSSPVSKTAVIEALSPYTQALLGLSLQLSQSSRRLSFV
jgi:Spy/CpxP family protein refolding chaperone